MSEVGILRALRILIVEDETIVAMMVEDMLLDFGCIPVGPARNLASAMTAATEEKLDGAILDVNLRGERVDPIADKLNERGIPFVFATGYGQAGIDTRFKAVPVLQKPFEATGLSRALMEIFTKAALP